MALRFDEKVQLAALAAALQDVLEAQGASFALEKVVMRGLSFPALTAEQAATAPNAQADLDELQKELENAQKHSLTWQNDIAPNITVLPQAFINVNAYVQAWRPVMSTMSKDQLIELLQATSSKIGAQVETLSGVSAAVAALRQKVVVDAGDFSEKHASFAELEKLDEKNLTATLAVIAKLKALIAKDNDTITADMLDANQNIELAVAIMKAGKEAKGKGSDWIKIAAVIVGEVFLFKANSEIEETLKLIGERLAAAELESENEINFTEVTVQLAAMHNASAALASFDGELTDVEVLFSAATQWFLDRQKDLTAIITAGALNSEINEISMMAYANQWLTLSTASGNWQMMEIAKPIVHEISLAGFDRKIKRNET